MSKRPPQVIQFGREAEDSSTFPPQFRNITRTSRPRSLTADAFAQHLALLVTLE